MDDGKVMCGVSFPAVEYNNNGLAPVDLPQRTRWGMILVANKLCQITAGEDD